MKQFTFFALMSLMVLVLVNSASAARYYCYQDATGSNKFYVCGAITQVQGTDSAIGKVTNGMVALANMIKRRVAFVYVDGQRLSADEFIESVGGQSGDRLILQYLPASGCHVGITAPGGVAMKQSWLVEAAPSSDVETESSGSSGSSYADTPNIPFSVIVITSKTFGIKSTDDLLLFDNKGFDGEGKLTDEFFAKHRGDMKIVEFERHHDITGFIRIKGRDDWDDMIDEVKYGSGSLYGTYSDLSYGMARAFSFENLTSKQLEYVRSNWFGRVWKTTKDKAGTATNTVKDKFGDLKLLGQ